MKAQSLEYYAGEYGDKRRGRYTPISLYFYHSRDTLHKSQVE
jgi:hypothetical protein